MWGRAVLILLPVALTAQSAEDFKLEAAAYGWRTGVEGTLQSGLFPIDLRADLDLDRRTTFFGRLSLKPARRHRIVIEGAPYRFEGRNTLTRTIVFNNRTYFVQDTVASSADLTYLFAGYQFDFIAAERGHAGIGLGGAYLDASGSISSATAGITAARSQRAGLPLASASFRYWIIPSVLNISGDAKGMSLGRYGHFVQTAIRAGIGWRFVTFEAGYQILNADIHEANGQPDPAGIAPRIRGPIFGIQVRR